jgi:hypothetical protein
MTDVNKQVTDTGKRKPPAAGKGRPKGAVNKLTKTIREAVEISFAQVGGADYLAQMAVEQPVAYMTLLGKIIPQQVEMSGKDGAAIQLEQVKNDAAAFTSAVVGLSARSGTAG